MSGPKRNKKSETRVSNIEWISISEDTGQQNHDINKGTKQETNWQIEKLKQVSRMSRPNRNNNSETRVSNIEWISNLEDIVGLQNHSNIIKGTKQETNLKIGKCIKQYWKYF